MHPLENVTLIFSAHLLILARQVKIVERTVKIKQIATYDDLIVNDKKNQIQM